MSTIYIKGVGAGGAMAPPYFGRSVNPISTVYAHLITTGTPGFSDLPMALYIHGCSTQFPHYSVPVSVKTPQSIELYCGPVQKYNGSVGDIAAFVIFCKAYFLLAYSRANCV